MVIQMPPAIPDHWPQIIAGCFAILGVVIGQVLSMISTSRERKQKRAAIMLEKLEELMTVDRAITNWVSDFQACTTFKEVVATSPTESCHHLRSLALLYFPNLQSVIDEYTSELQLFHSFGMRCSVDTIQQNLGAQLLTFHETKYQERTQAMKMKHGKLGDAIQAEAQRHLPRN